MTAARGVALGALLLAAVLVAVLLLGGRQRDEVQGALRRTPASSSRTTTCRSAAGASGTISDIKLTHEQPGRGRHRGRPGVLAAARGHARGHPRHVAVGHRQPLHRADARAEQRAQARRGRGARRRRHDDIVDLDQLFNTLDPKARKSLQRVIKGSADAVRRQGRPGQRGRQVLQPRAVDDAPARQRGQPRLAHARALHRRRRQGDDRAGREARPS